MRVAYLPTREFLAENIAVLEAIEKAKSFRTLMDEYKKNYGFYLNILN